MCANPNMLADLSHFLMVNKRLIKEHSGTVHLDGFRACEDKGGEGGEGKGGVFVPHLHTDTHRKTEHGQVFCGEGEVVVVNVWVS